MKRIFAAVLMCGAGSCIATDAATEKNAVPVSAGALKAQAAKQAAKDKAAADLLASMAPADEYFGPLKLSIIGISNTIRDIGLRYKFNHDLSSQSLASAQLSESAIRDWMKRYPHDPQLPRNVFYLQRLYSQILLQTSRDRAGVIAKLLFTSFPASPQAKQLKKTLAVEHLAPLDAPSPASEATVQPAVAPSGEPIPTDAPLPYASPAPYGATAAPYGGPTPVPTGSLVPVPLGSPNALRSVSPFAVPTAAPSISPAPAPSPTTQSAPTAAATTLPSPGPIVSATPVPSGTAAPAPVVTPGASPAPTSTASPR